MKRVIISIFLAALFLVTAAAVIPFAQEQTALEALRDRSLVTGYEDGSLQPETLLTRAQFAQLLCKAFPDKAAEGKSTGFSDLSADHWAYTVIEAAVSAGWLTGYPDGTVRPDDTLTYEQAATVLCRALGLVYSGAAYPADYLAAAMEHALTDRVNALIGETVTREQAATMLLNALSHEEGQIDRGYSGYSNALAGSATASLMAGGSGGSSAAVYSTEAPVAEDAMGDMAKGAIVSEAEGYMPVIDAAAVIGGNTESYTMEAENVFKDPLTSPLSTFSIDTDTASYSNLRRFIVNGQPIPGGAVRSEELINYFDYTPAEAEAGKPFGTRYTVAACPWNPSNLLAMVTVSGQELTEPKPSNLVFLIDVSGSMYSYNKLPLVKQSLGMLLDKLGAADTVSIVTYASGVGVALEPTPATEKETILAAIDSLQAGGGTAGAGGITLAYEQAEKHRCDGNNRIILCTDGDFNIGISSDGDLQALITEKRESGIFLSVLGFGMGNYKDSKMELLADNGNGSYAYIDNLREAKKVLVDEMPKTIYTIAKDVKLQVEFNPEQVAQYRLIGYENRRLENEDFENDAKDAGELGAGATVTVLYEIVSRNGTAESDLKYQTPQLNGSDELMTLKIRYKLPEGEESILAEYPVASTVAETPEGDFYFAAAVAELGMLLNESEFKGNADYDSVIALARAGLGEDTFGLRSEFIQLVDLLRFKNK